MFMRKVLWMMMLSFVLLGVSVCDNDKEVDERFKEIFILGVEAGAIDMTYKEWVESIKGEDGENGSDGREVVFGVSDDHIQWQYEGDEHRRI